MSAGTLHYCLYSPFAPFPFLHDGHPEDIHMQLLLRDCVQVVYGISDLSVFFFFPFVFSDVLTILVLLTLDIFLPFYVEEPMQDKMFFEQP